MLRRVLCVFVVAVCTATMAVADKKNANDGRDDLHGTWQVIAGETNGQKAADDQVAELQIIIEADKLTIKPDGEGRKTTFTMDSGKTPKTINLTPLDGSRKGSIVPGIYALRNGQLQLCINIWGKDPAHRPTEFKTQAGDGVVLLTLKRTTHEDRERSVR